MELPGRQKANQEEMATSEEEKKERSTPSPAERSTGHPQILQKLWCLDGEKMESDRLYLLGLQKSLQMVTAAMKLKDTRSLEEKL